MLRPLLAAVVVALLAAPVAAAGSSPVQVLGPNGRVIAQSTGGAFDYPARGRAVHVGSTSITSAGVRLDDVSLLGGRIQALRVFVPRHGRSAAIDGLYVDGRAVEPHVNGLIPLSPMDYLITSQAAVTNGRRLGLVGLRLSLGDRAAGLPAGSQVLVGLPVAPRQAAQRVAVSSKRVSPLAVLGFTEGVPGFAGSSQLPFFAVGSRGRQAAALAGRLLGIPYVWGGETPSGGFDCSGLVMYVFAKLGVSVPHGSTEQYAYGTHVTMSQLQPGDIVFFYPGLSHNGIYIGNGLFIHAPHTGDVVKISALAGHYTSVFQGATRL